MRKLILIQLFVGIATLATAQIPLAQATRLQYIFDSICTRVHMKGASAAVLIPNVGIWKGAYGISHDGVPIDTSMYFGIGSNTKTYIATLLLQMQEDKLLDLDDTIGTWMQNVANVNGQVTIRQMLAHKSGIYNFTNNPEFTVAMNNDFNAIWKPEDVLQFIKAPTFAPGTNWEYSNSNYLIAGLIIQKALDTPLHAALRMRILQPQGLDYTVLFPHEQPSGTIPHSWSIHFPRPYLEDIMESYNYSNNAMFSMAWGAGAIMATAEDNVKFWSKLISGSIISDSSFLEMRNFTPLGGQKSYGLGIFRLTNYNRRTVFSHGGTNVGFINDNIADPENGVCISVLTNQDSVSNAMLLQQLINALHKEILSPTTSVQVMNSELSVSVYPNPASNHVNLIMTEQGYYTVYMNDITGRTVCTREIQNAPGISISLADMQQGQYILYLKNDKNQLVYATKLVVLK